MANDHHVAVVGRGLIGSAAARHLAESGVSVALIGAGEPADYTTSSGPFSSHYDQGRITRISSASAVWAELAARSVARYRDIETRADMAFHDPRGLAQASRHAAAAVDNANQRGGSARLVDPAWLRRTTGIAVRPDHPSTTFYEDAPAGLINPRQLVRAQTLLAEQAGALVVDSPASAIRPGADGVTIECGRSITASYVILATGAYGATLVGVDLAVERRLRTITLAELGPGHEIPSYIDDAPGHPNLGGIYWVPPVRFPDGRTMLKIGGESLPTITADNDTDIADWFRKGGSPAEAAALQQTVRMLLPDANVTSWDHKPCVITNTESELPFIGFVDDRVIVALGANGSGAKSSDELGRLASTLTSATGWHDTELNLDTFEPQLRS